MATTPSVTTDNLRPQIDCSAYDACDLYTQLAEVAPTWASFTTIPSTWKLTWALDRERDGLEVFDDVFARLAEMREVSDDALPRIAVLIVAVLQATSWTPVVDHRRAAAWALLITGLSAHGFSPKPRTLGAGWVESAPDVIFDRFGDSVAALTGFLRETYKPNPLHGLHGHHLT